MPTGAGRPNGAEVLDEIGVPVVAEFPKPLTDEVAQAAELVITIACGDACPIYHGRRYMEWPVAASIGQPWRTYATSGTISPVMAPNLGASPSSRMRGEFPLSEANRPVIGFCRGSSPLAVSVLLRGERGSVASGG